MAIQWVAEDGVWIQLFPHQVSGFCPLYTTSDPSEPGTPTQFLLLCILGRVSLETPTITEEREAGPTAVRDDETIGPNTSFAHQLPGTQRTTWGGWQGPRTGRKGGREPVSQRVRLWPWGRGSDAQSACTSRCVCCGVTHSAVLYSHYRVMRCREWRPSLPAQSLGGIVCHMCHVKAQLRALSQRDFRTDGSWWPWYIP